MPDTPKPKPPKLTSLRHRPKTDQEVDAVCEAMSGESDRTAAILAAAELDCDLEEIIVKSFDGNINDEARNTLFGESGPLSSLGIKAQLGFALGLFGELTRDDIIIIAKIRNAFAHSPRHLAFDNELIVKNCTHLKSMDHCAAVGIIEDGDIEDWLSSPRSRFMFTALNIPTVIHKFRTQFHNANIKQCAAQMQTLKRCGEAGIFLTRDELSEIVKPTDQIMAP